MILYIKNMVCNRCKMVVANELHHAGMVATQIELGEIQLSHQPSEAQLIDFRNRIEQLGFEIIDDKKSKIISRIKTIIIELIYHEGSELKVNLSDYISQLLGIDYHYLSVLFSDVEGTTIEKYYIAQKIERVKELLVYNEFTLSEIAYKLNYSSVAHLSNQFKKVTGLTPSHFKQIRELRRKPLDEV